MEAVDTKNPAAEDRVATSRSESFTHHAEAVLGHRETYGPPGLRGLFTNPYVALCAAFSTLGGLVFGYDQGVVSIILVMPQFLEQFPRVATAGAGFWKGLLTAMIELGAFLGGKLVFYVPEHMKWSNYPEHLTMTMMMTLM